MVIVAKRLYFSTCSFYPRWPGHVRSTHRVAQRQEAAPCRFNLKFAFPNTMFACRLFFERAWRSLLSLRDPGALRDGWATRSLVAQATLQWSDRLRNRERGGGRQASYDD